MAYLWSTLQALASTWEGWTLGAVLIGYAMYRFGYKPYTRCY